MVCEKNKTCCFFGHRKLQITAELKNNLRKIVEELIADNGIDTFLFGSKSQFNDVAYVIVSELKEIYPFVRRIYVRAEYPIIDDSYMSYLLEGYEDTYYPENILGAGRAAYVERNREMIKKSVCCICYYDENYAPARRKNSKKDLSDYQPKSGTRIAYDYAVKRCGKVINIADLA